MVMKKRGNIKKKYQPDPYKIIINTCLSFFFQPVCGSSLYEPVANEQKALSRGSTLMPWVLLGPFFKVHKDPPGAHKAPNKLLFSSRRPYKNPVPAKRGETPVFYLLAPGFHTFSD
jgi:hypothetical protein